MPNHNPTPPPETPQEPARTQGCDCNCAGCDIGRHCHKRTYGCFE
jgi:hypothetical protein